MSGRAKREAAVDRADVALWDMLLRVREIDPGAEAEAVRRYAREIAEADAVLRALDQDPSSAPMDALFSPEWKSERPQ